MTWSLKTVEALAGGTSQNKHSVENHALAIVDFLDRSPLDFLEPLLASPFGRVYGLFLQRCCTQKFDSALCIAKRDELSHRLRQIGCENEESWALLLSIFILFPPDQLKVDDASSKLPAWLYSIYKDRYESSPNLSPQSEPSSEPTGNPSFNDRIFLNKILGLSNLYYIDPEDQEILDELREVRLQTVDLMLSTTSEELGRQFLSDFGDRYWAMAQSGIQKVAHNSIESQKRDALQHWLSTTPNSLHQEGGIQRFSAILLFNPPGSVQIANPAQNLPQWFLEGYNRLNSMATA
jgi:hypothetical protein